MTCWSGQGDPPADLVLKGGWEARCRCGHTAKFHIIHGSHACIICPSWGCQAFLTTKDKDDIANAVRELRDIERDLS